MAGIVVVDDPGDPRLADYARLTDVRLRTSMEPAHGLFVAEGDKVIRRAVAAGYRVRSMLVTRDKLAGLADVADACPGPVYVISHEVAEQVTGYRVHRGALASMARRPLPTVTGLLSGALWARDLSGGPLAGDLSGGPLAGGLSGGPLARDLSGGPLAGDGAVAGDAGPAAAGTAHQADAGRPGWPRRIVLLEDLVDHGNVGGIFRCAAALGVDAVILSPRCADPLYRRAVKVSMGAVFTIPYARMSDAGPVGDAAGQAGAHGPGRAAPRDRGRRAVLPLAGGGGYGGLHSDERGRDGAGGRFAERGRGRRDRLSRTGAPALVSGGAASVVAGRSAR